MIEDKPIGSPITRNADKSLVFTGEWDSWFDKFTEGHNTLARLVKEHTYNKRIHLTKEEKSALQGVVRSGGDLLEGFPDHNDLSGLQGGTTNEYYHLTQADYLESVNFFDGGSTTRTGVDSHIADSAIHKTEFDETVYTHTSGKLTQEVDKLATATVGTHNTTYNSEGRVNTVVVDSGTWTFTYNGDGTLAGTIKT